MTALEISRDAARDLQEIGDFIAEDNVDAAIEFIARLRARCTELSVFPGLGRKRDEIKRGYRSIGEGDYVVFYRLRKGDVVEIMRFIHAKRDLSKIKFK